MEMPKSKVRTHVLELSIFLKSNVPDPTNPPVAGALPILRTQAPQTLAGPPSFLPTGLPRPRKMLPRI